MADLPVTSSGADMSRVPMDYVCDITKEQLTQFNLNLLPCFFGDAERVRLNLVYVYVGWTKNKKGDNTNEVLPVAL